MTNSLILVIPAFAPEPSLIKLVNQVHESFARVIVVDDGSGDKYRDIFKELEHISNIRLLTHNHNCGKGIALKTAFQNVLEEQGRFDVVTADADGQHLPEDILKVAEALSSNNNSLVLGCRDFKSAPWRNHLGNFLSALVFYLFAGRHPTDTQTGLRGIPASFLPEIVGFPEKAYDFEARMLLAAVHLKYEINEIPISTVYHDDGVSHFRPLRDSGKIALCVLREFRRRNNKN
jgi:glycosyltransferase involved in cell wall biosynthesis